MHTLEIIDGDRARDTFAVYKRFAGSSTFSQPFKSLLHQAIYLSVHVEFGGHLYNRLNQHQNQLIKAFINLKHLECRTLIRKSCNDRIYFELYRIWHVVLYITKARVGLLFDNVWNQNSLYNNIPLIRQIY